MFSPILIWKMLYCAMEIYNEKRRGRRKACCCQLSLMERFSLAFFHDEEIEKTSQGAGRVKVIQPHRVRLPEIFWNRILTFAYHKLYLRGRLLYPILTLQIALQNSVTWEESYFSGQTKAWGCSGFTGLWEAWGGLEEAGEAPRRGIKRRR